MARTDLLSDAPRLGSPFPRSGVGTLRLKCFSFHEVTACEPSRPPRVFTMETCRHETRCFNKAGLRQVEVCMEYMY